MNASVVNDSESQWDNYDYDFFIEWNEHQRKLELAFAVLVLALAVFGTIFNITAIAVLFRRRLWKQHEGYLYLLAIFIGNILAAIVVYLHVSLSGFRVEFKLENASEFTCKMWRFLYHVFFSTGWYASAMLLNACMHGRLARNIGCPCWHRLASKYCTVVGSLVVNGLITCFFVIMNCWMLWKAELVHYHEIYETEEVHESYCLIRELNITWMIVSNSIQAFVPVCFVIPVLLVVAVWSSRIHGTGFTPITSGQEDQNNDAKVFARLSTIVGAAVFLLQFPAAVVELWLMTQEHAIPYLIIEVVMLIFASHIVVVPLCFLAGGRQTRDEVKLLFTRACCSRNNLTDDIYRPLSLEPIENPSTETVAPE